MPYNNIRAGIIGGSGFYQLDFINVIDTIKLKTPWGYPSDDIIIGEYKKERIAFLSRHGRGHAHSPSQIPYLANMAAMKMLGVQKILAFSACGSFKQDLSPGSFVIPDQIIDRTRHRKDTYYNEGIVVHVSFGNPFTKEIADTVEQGLNALNFPFYKNETLICMEGPAFSTRAESLLYKSWNAGVINMTTIPEAKLARELEIAYQVVCMVTDYDSWRITEESIDGLEILKVLQKNTENVNILLKNILPNFSVLNVEKAESRHAVKNGIITAKEKRPANIVAKYNSLFGNYF